MDIAHDASSSQRWASLTTAHGTRRCASPPVCGSAGWDTGGSSAPDPEIPYDKRHQEKGGWFAEYKQPAVARMHGLCVAGQPGRRRPPSGSGPAGKVPAGAR